MGHLMNPPFHPYRGPTVQLVEVSRWPLQLELLEERLLVMAEWPLHLPLTSGVIRLTWDHFDLMVSGELDRRRMEDETLPFRPAQRSHSVDPHPGAPRRPARRTGPSPRTCVDGRSRRQTRWSATATNTRHIPDTTSHGPTPSGPPSRCNPTSPPVLPRPDRLDRDRRGGRPFESRATDLADMTHQRRIQPLKPLRHQPVENRRGQQSRLPLHDGVDNAPSNRRPSPSTRRSSPGRPVGHSPTATSRASPKLGGTLLDSQAISLQSRHVQELSLRHHVGVLLQNRMLGRSELWRSPPPQQRIHIRKNPPPTRLSGSQIATVTDRPQKARATHLSIADTRR